MSNTANSGTPLRLAIAGLGLVGTRHATALAQVPRAQLAAVADPGTAVKEEAMKRGLCYYGSLAELIVAERPDGVILATPTVMHVEQALQCVRAGIPVLVEKPLAHDVPSAAALVAEAKAKKVPLLVGHHRRFNPLIGQARHLIDQGDIGEIRAVQATCWFYKPDHYFETAPWRKESGAGPISVNLVHDIDLIRYLCGEVETVQAQATPSRRGHHNEDVAAAVLRLENGAIATISVSDGIVSPWSWEMTSKEYPIYPATSQSAYLIGGSHGSLSIPDQHLWRHGTERDWWSPISATSLPGDSSDPLVNQIAHFTDVISGNAPPLVSGEEGLRTLRVVDAIQQAADTGDTVYPHKNIHPASENGGTGVA